MSDQEETQDRRLPDPGRIKQTLNEQMSLIDELGRDLQRNIQDLLYDTDIETLEIPDSQEEAIINTLKQYSDQIPSTSKLGTIGLLAGGLVGGPGGAILLGSAGAGIGAWKDLQDDRMLLALEVEGAPSDVQCLEYENELIQNTRPIKYTVLFAAKSDMDMSRVRNTIAKVRDFDMVADAFKELPTTTLPSSDFPEVCYVNCKGKTIAVWIESTD